MLIRATILTLCLCGAAFGQINAGDPVKLKAGGGVVIPGDASVDSVTLGSTDPTTNEGRVTWDPSNEVLMIGAAGGRINTAKGSTTGVALTASALDANPAAHLTQYCADRNADGSCATLQDLDDLQGILRTRQSGFMLGADGGAALADADDQETIWSNVFGSGVTVTKIWCQSDAGTPIVQLQRDDGTPADMCTANLTCTTTGATCTVAAAEDNLAADEEIDFLMVTAGGTAARVSIFVVWTVD